MQTDLAGRTAIVTGAGSVVGLGHAIARELASRGADVVIHDMALPEESAQSIREAGGSAVPFASDLSVEDGMSDLVRFAVTQFGRLDILVNNAGIAEPFTALVDLDAALWDKVLAINLRACFFGIKHAAAQMKRQTELGTGWGRGRIVSIASQAAKTGIALHGAYSTSKHGLLGLTRSAAVELGRDGITVNAICPNHIGTALGTRLNHELSAVKGQTLDEYKAAMVARIPMGRLGTTADSAGVCGFLCSSAAAYITGEAWNVAGGEEYH